MFNIKEYNTVYKTYINYILHNLYSLFQEIVKYNLYVRPKKRKKSIKNISIYFDLISFKSVNLINYTSYYTVKDSNSYYSITVPIKFIFANTKTFSINYNILNIPKISELGDVLINGYNRTPVLYLKSIVKYVEFDFNNSKYIYYLLYLDKYNYAYIYLKDNSSINININKKYYIDLNIYDINLILNKEGSALNIYKFIKFFNLIELSDYTVLNEDFLYSLNLLGHFDRLVCLDIVHLITKFIKIKYRKNNDIDTDNILNKSVCNLCINIFDLFKKSITSSNFFKYITYMHSDYGTNNLFNIKLFREDFLINPSLHYTNNLNLLAILNNKSKINIFGYSATADSNSTFSIPKALRNVQYNYLNLINILYTIDGEKCGVISTVTANTLQTNSQLNTILVTTSKFKNKICLNAYSKNIYCVPINKLNLIKKNINVKIGYVEVVENGEFKIIKLTKNNSKFEVNLYNVFNITELVIPFLLNNDMCRSLMGSKMHTQAVPLIYTNNQYVLTKYNKLNNLLTNKYIISTSSGVVVYSTNYKITVLDNKNRYINYYLSPYNINDYNSYNNYKPSVWEGEAVTIGSVLAFPSDVNNFEFTLGFNNLTSYSFYYGYEHEDAIVLNKSLIYKNILASLLFNVIDINLSYTVSAYLELLISKNIKSIDYLYKVVYSTYKKLKKQTQKSYKILFKNRIIKTKRKAFFKRKYIHSNNLVERALKLECVGFNNFKHDNKLEVYLNLKLFLLNINNLYRGDKLCGRHGNKGTVSIITDPINIPYNSKDFSPYIITSPVGAAARMNLGQFLEGALGNLSNSDNVRIKAPINLLHSDLYSNLSIKAIYNNLNPKYIDNKINSNSNSIFRDFKTGYKLKNFTYNVLLYFFKLVHTSKSKFKYRRTDDLSLTQYLHNNSPRQKFGEMEVWSLESHGASFNEKELSLIKTDYKFLTKINQNKSLILSSKSFNLLLMELKSILINIDYNQYYKNSKNYTDI
uniref:DNA-directed RNA polymerase n=1 Tax=Babesia motasi TaxID=237580 RepID=A0A411ADI0_9APIC|nr:RpoB [Babesia motasi]